MKLLEMIQEIHSLGDWVVSDVSQLASHSFPSKIDVGKS
jgi:hypothetical protein